MMVHVSWRPRGLTLDAVLSPEDRSTVFDVPHDPMAIERAIDLIQQMQIRNLPILSIAAGARAYLSILADMTATPGEKRDQRRFAVGEGQSPEREVLVHGIRFELDMLSWDETTSGSRPDSVVSRSS